VLSISASHQPYMYTSRGITVLYECSVHVQFSYYINIRQPNGSLTLMEADKLN
jgi:hypothetical protein